MPFGQQPKYMHCVDMLPDPHRAKDWNTIWKAMVDEGKKVNNGEKRKEDRKKLWVSSQRFRTALLPTADPGSLFSSPIGEAADEEFQAFAAAGIRGTDVYS